MLEDNLYCPLPHPLESSNEILADLRSLIDYLVSDRPITDKTIFPRGTVMPDGRLDLCKQNLGVTGCQLVTAALVNNSAIASLLLGTNGIGDEGAKSVAQLIQHNQRLEVVYLGCNAISQTGIAALAEALTHNTSVTGLWLKRNPIGVAGAYHLVEMLRHNKSIRTLDLVSTQIGEEGLAAILEVLTYTNRSVERLYLGSNQIQPNHALMLADLLHHNPTSEVPQLASLKLGLPTLANNDGLIRLRSFPLHQPMPPSSHDNFGREGKREEYSFRKARFLTQPQ